MKRAQIRAAVDGHLTALGFGRGNWSWDGPILSVLINDHAYVIKLTTKTSKHVLIAQLFRMQGWAEAGGIRARARRLNGAGLAHEAEPFALQA